MQGVRKLDPPSTDYFLPSGRETTDILQEREEPSAPPPSVSVCERSAPGGVTSWNRRGSPSGTRVVQKSGRFPRMAAAASGNRRGSRVGRSPRPEIGDVPRPQARRSAIPGRTGEKVGDSRTCSSRRARRSPIPGQRPARLGEPRQFRDDPFVRRFCLARG